jgi:phosphatidylglycerophosphatase A
MSGVYVPPRYRVRLNADFKPGQPAQVEIDLLPTGVFGIQDGRTPRRAESGSIVFDQKTGEFVLQGPAGEPIILDPVSLEGFSLGIGRPLSIVGNRLMWTQPGTSAADGKEASKAIEGPIQSLVAVLPIFGYRRRVPISVSKIVVKQDEQVVGWAELVAVNLVVRPYKREIFEEELLTFEPWLRTIRLDTARWWAMMYWDRAIRHQETPFLDDSYAEIIINLWKAAEAILGTWKLNEVEESAMRLGLTDAVAEEVKWLYTLRHSDDVAHAVIYRKQSAEQVEALYADRHEKVRRAENVVRAIIDHVLGGAGDVPVSVELKN